jgi:hypothetical protein
MPLKIDNCKYCAAITHTRHNSLQSLLFEIEKGGLGCWLCMEDGDHHTEFDIFNKNIKIWCGHTQKCKDVIDET